MIDSYLNTACPMDVDSYRVYFRTQGEKLCSVSVEEDISKLMIDRAKNLDDITELGESSKVFKSWEVHPLKDLWFYFRKIANKGDDRKTTVLAKVRANELKEGLESDLKKPDFFRHIFGQKITSSKYYMEVLRHFSWSVLEPNLEIKQELAQRMIKFANQKEFIRGAAVMLFHYNASGAVKSLQRQLEEVDQLSNKTQEEVQSLLRFVKSMEEIYSRATQKTSLLQLILKSDYDNLRFSPGMTNEEQDLIAEAIEFKGMLKMMTQQIANIQYSDEYLNLIRDFLCKEINVKKILMCQEISFNDRLPFLIRFAPQELMESLDSCVEEAVEQGYLEFISMLEDEGQIINLVQAYLDRSCDIQTAAAVGLKLLSLKLITKEEGVSKITAWYKNYQSFLNKNQLYLRRAKTDEKKIEIYKQALGTTREDQTKHAELYFYCGQCKTSYSISQYLRTKKQGKDIERLNRDSTLANKQFVNTCISCSKPTPLCSICYLPINLANPVQKMMEKLRMHPKAMGPDGSGNKGNQDMIADDTKFATFDQYIRINSRSIVWCVNCLHGGHALHIEKWFEFHDECPVANCRCQCSQL